MKKLSVFLSHSHKDIDKVRKVRNLLEILGCEPLIFYLKSMDNDDELQDYIKEEIELRNVFIYCKSKNAENSKWVQNEVEYIKSFDKNRLHEIDIDNAFEFGVLEMIEAIGKIIKSNRIFLDYSLKDKEIASKITNILSNLDIEIFDINSIEEYYNVDTKTLLQELIYVPLITDNFCESSINMANYIEVCDNWQNNLEKANVAPIIYNYSEKILWPSVEKYDPVYLKSEESYEKELIKFAKQIATMV